MGRTSSLIGKIIEVKKETKDTSTLTLQLSEAMHWELGQFIMVRADINGKSVRRAYTISSSPTRENLQITVRQTSTPTMSKYLNERRVGDELEIKGPYGKFKWHETNSPKLFCFSAGSGITPSRAFFQYFIDNKLTHPITLLYSCRAGDNVIFREELEQLVSQITDCRYSLSITRNPAGLSNIRQGRIDERFLKVRLEGWRDAHFYLCGSPGFVNHMIDMLIKLGIEKSAIFREKWG